MTADDRGRLAPETSAAARMLDAVAKASAAAEAAARRDDDRDGIDPLGLLDGPIGDTEPEVLTVPLWADLEVARLVELDTGAPIDLRLLDHVFAAACRAAAADLREQAIARTLAAFRSLVGTAPAGLPGGSAYGRAGA